MTNEPTTPTAGPAGDEALARRRNELVAAMKRGYSMHGDGLLANMADQILAAGWAPPNDTTNQPATPAVHYANWVDPAELAAAVAEYGETDGPWCPTCGYRNDRSPAAGGCGCPRTHALSPNGAEETPHVGPPVALNPEAVGDPDQTPVVRLSPALADLVRQDGTR